MPELSDRMYPAGALRVRVDHMGFEPGPGSGSEPVASGAEADPVAWWEDGARWDGGFWNPGDGGEGWGTGDFPRRRRSRVLRATGFVVAVALVLGSLGTALEVVLGGSSTTALAARVTGTGSVAPGGSPAPDAGSSSGSSQAATAGERIRVSFTVVNDSGGEVTPVCVVSVVRGGKVVGSLAVPLPRPLAQGSAAAERVAVPVNPSVPAGSSAGARVACRR